MRYQGNGSERPKDRGAGFTLIELLMVITIMGILAAIAYPGYQQYVTRSKRGLAKSSLVQVLDRQAQFFADNKAFATDLTNLNFVENGFGIDKAGKQVSSSSGDRIYIIQLAAGASATAFTVQAVPQLVQASNDTKCGTLSVTSAGTKSASGPSPDCW